MPIVFHLSTQAEVEVKRQGDPDERHGERGEQPRIATIAPRAVRTATASRTALRPRATMCRLEHIGPDLSREPRDEVASQRGRRWRRASHHERNRHYRAARIARTGDGPRASAASDTSSMPRSPRPVTGSRDPSRSVVTVPFMVAGASPSVPALTGDLVSRFSTQVGSDVFEPTHGRSRSKSSSTCCGRSHCSGGYRRNPRLFAALTVSFIGITLALDLYLGLSREVKYDRHEYFGSDTNALPILVGSLLAIVVHNDWAVSDGSVSCSLCAASRCPPARPGISERHLSLLPGDRRGDRTDARDVDRCRDAAAIGRWIAAGKRPNAVAGRAVVFDLSLECPGANRDTLCTRTYGSR